MRTKILLVLIPIVLLLQGFHLHKFYVSLCQVDHNQETGSLEITMKIFTDDLEYGITGSLDYYGLGSVEEPNEADSLIFSYIRKNFEIQVDGRVTELEYIGKEVELDVTWCYIEIEGVKDPKEITISNRMLTEIYVEQVNIVNVTISGKTRGLLLDLRNSRGSLSF